MFLPHKILEMKLLSMLAEDVGQGDVSAGLIVPPGIVAHAEVRCKEAGVVAGIEEAAVLLESLGLNVQSLCEDGNQIRVNQVLLKVSGNARTILSAERTVLNLLSRMSGIATATDKLVKRLRKAGFQARVASTRKTAPGLLYFDKKAVSLGGGDTHRLHLDDMILVKSNHILLAGGLEKAVRRAREHASFSKKIEVEVKNVREALKAAEAGVDVIMLDNFAPRQVETAIKALDRAGLSRKPLLEISGGITAENLSAFVSKKVDIVSLGEITESARGLDINMKICPTE